MITCDNPYAVRRVPATGDPIYWNVESVIAGNGD